MGLDHGDFPCFNDLGIARGLGRGGKLEFFRLGSWGDMKRNAVGFYWTLPVPWIGFTELPDAVEEVAKVSMTIRYQMHMIRRHAEESRLPLVHEAVYMEVSPDRGQ